jgi:hypothetical protein
MSARNDTIQQMTEAHETREWIVAGAAVAAAVGTLSAVLVALYRDTWREWRSRPRLSLHLDPNWTESNRDLFWQQGQSPSLLASSEGQE